MTTETMPERAAEDTECAICGKEIDAGRPVVWFELNRRTLAYHAVGDVPDNESQGCFEVGPTCARKLRKALKALTPQDNDCANCDVPTYLCACGEND